MFWRLTLHNLVSSISLCVIWIWTLSSNFSTIFLPYSWQKTLNNTRYATLSFNFTILSQKVQKHSFVRKLSHYYYNLSVWKYLYESFHKKIKFKTENTNQISPWKIILAIAINANKKLYSRVIGLMVILFSVYKFSNDLNIALT